MACSSMAIHSSSATSRAKDVFKDRSDSGKDLFNKASIRRSYSDNHLHYSINQTRASIQPKLKRSQSVGIFPFQISGSIIPNSLRSFLFDPETSRNMNLMDKNIEMVQGLEDSNDGSEGVEIKRANWVERLLEIRSNWRKRQQKDDVNGDKVCDMLDNDDNYDCDGNEGGCTVDCDSEEEGEDKTFDQERFSRFLAEVPWSDIKLYSKLAFLSNMAYVIPEIKAEDLKRYYGLQFVTSSLEKKAEAASIKAKVNEDSIRTPVTSAEVSQYDTRRTEDPKRKYPIRSSAAYEIAASAASYVQSQIKSNLTCGSELLQESDFINACRCKDHLDEEGENSSRVYKPEVAAYVAASTMTAVVAAGEREKQKAARDLQSLHSSPCEWFICDDLSTYTRCFVIQGSDSLASWQANLFFEPAKFEGKDVLVHRGIYEAAKGIYEQFMPEIIEHLNRYGERSKFQFTGHSLGGSLSLLVNLMLLTRNVVKPSTLRPVVTFGSPFVFCGGQKLLSDLGLDDSHVHCVMMHRDIVPRAFSCDYPNHIAVVLKRLNSFRSHPCLIKNKLLYTPLGKLFILQPDEKSSPAHPLLPHGSALYALDKTQGGSYKRALRAFLNSPHPLETLSYPTAYGSGGTILRDHDSSNYLKAVNGVLRQNTKIVPRRVRKHNNHWWPLLASPSPHSWNNNENNLRTSRLVTKEVMTSV